MQKRKDPKKALLSHKPSRGYKNNSVLTTNRACLKQIIRPVLCFIAVILVFVFVIFLTRAQGQAESGTASHAALPDLPALNQRVSALLDAGKYDEALPLAQEALTLAEKKHGAVHPEVGATLSNLALVYEATGAYGKAETMFQRAYAIYRDARGPNDLTVATALNNLGSLYRTMGAYGKAEAFLQQTLAVKEKILGPEHVDVATSLNNLAELYRTIGKYRKAEPLYLRTLAIYEKTLGPSHLAVGVARNNLALLYEENGDYAMAEPSYREALAIYEQALGPRHPDVANSLNNLAGLYRTMGLYAKAEPLYRRALMVRESALGPDHPDVATSLNNLGDLYRVQGQYAQAEPLYRRAYNIYVKTLGPAHRAVAATVNNLGMMYEAAGNNAEAERVFRGAVAIYEKALGPAHPDYATAVNNLAALYHKMGSYERAEPLFQHALAIREKALGAEHPDVAASLINLASVAAARKNYGAAVRYLQTGSALQDRLIPNVFAFTTEKQKLQFIQTLSGSYFGSLSLLHQHLGQDQSAVREGLELVWRRKGIVFDAESHARDALQVRLSDAGRKLAKEVVVLRGELASLLLHRPEHMNGAQYHAAVEALLEQIEEHEQRLSSESAGVAREREQRTPDLKAVTQRLLPNAALVEFVKIRDYDFAARKWRSTWRYLAFVLAATGNVSLVDLGDTTALEAQVERAIEDIRATMVATRRQFFLKSIQSMDDLSKRVWTPLEKSIGSADKLLVSPDGILSLVPFVALRDQQGRLLVERFQLAYVSSGREVVGLEGPPPQPGINLLLVANPAFDLKNPSVGNRTVPSSAQENRLNFSPLPGTEREAQEIPSLVPGQAKLKQVLVGGQATESAVKSAHSPRIMHLATHGFFLEDKMISPDQEGRGATRKYENPLVRSGLAFAGANHASETTEGDDGILTALEITGMDLTGTELVVLSACESGVGDVQIGEGVFGLRRSFALAGAKNLMMSLWPIADEITANQMNAFYQKLQVLPPAEALRRAQLDTIRELKLEFNGLAPPGLWAPFILQGAHALGS